MKRNFVLFCRIFVEFRIRNLASEERLPEKNTHGKLPMATTISFYKQQVVANNNNNTKATKKERKNNINNNI